MSHACIIAGCCLTIAIISVQCYLHCCLPRCLPQSFTVGESAIIAQAIATFLLHSGLHYFTAVSVYAFSAMPSVLCLQCFDTVGWATGRASGL